MLAFQIVHLDSPQKTPIVYGIYIYTAQSVWSVEAHSQQLLLHQCDFIAMPPKASTKTPFEKAVKGDEGEPGINVL